MMRLPVMLLIAIIIVIILMALFGYFTGRWEESKPAAWSSLANCSSERSSAGANFPSQWRRTSRVPFSHFCTV
jgi:hypothetical protein